MKKVYCTYLLLGLLVGCSAPPKNYVLKVKPVQLTKENMFDKVLVMDALFDAEELDVDSLKGKSRQLFLQAIDCYKNKKDPQRSIGLFKSSLLTFPDSKTYYELGNALLEVGGQEFLIEATKAYEVAIHLGFQPLSTVYYNLTCANMTLYSLPFASQEGLEDTEETKLKYFNEAAEGLYHALEEGFYDTLNLKQDARLTALVYSERGKELLLNSMAKRLKGNGNGLFSLFRKSFPTSDLPFAIPIEHVTLPDFHQSISYDFAPYIQEMENVSFGRSVSNEFFYVGKVTETPQYTALIYKSVSFNDMERSPIFSTLATFDAKGEVVSKIMISCDCSASKVKTAKVNTSEIVIEEYRREWEHPIDKVSFDENKVKSLSLVSKTTYAINDLGKIEEVALPNEANDSTTTASDHINNEKKN